MNQLYIQHGLSTANMTPKGMHFREWLKTAKKYTITAGNRGRIKAQEAPYAISGEVLDAYRNDANVLARDLVAVDLDSIAETYTSSETLYKALETLLKATEFWLYPTISNGFKGAHYRLIIPLERPLEEHPYRVLVQAINSELKKAGILTEVDTSNWTWSQAFGLPLDPATVRHHDGKSYLFTDQQAQAWEKELAKRDELNPKKPLLVVTNTRNYGQHDYNRKIGLIDQLCYFIAGIDEGQRNKSLYTFARSIYSVYELKYKQVFPAEQLDGVVELLRGISATRLNPPLKDNEIITIVESAYRGYATRKGDQQ